MSGVAPFDEAFRARLRDLFVWRRDVRRFRRDALPPGTLERLIGIACLAPSVGLSQPWRFVVVDDLGRRQAVREAFKACNAEALKTYSGERAGRYAALKLAGLEEAPCQFAVFADTATATGHGLGRLTMPEMVEYSAVTAVSLMWLAARAEGIGMGWVSILDPAGHRGHSRRARRLAPDRLFLSRLSRGRERPPRARTRRLGGTARRLLLRAAALNPSRRREKLIRSASAKTKVGARQGEPRSRTEQKIRERP